MKNNVPNFIFLNGTPRMVQLLKKKKKKKNLYSNFMLYLGVDFGQTVLSFSSE